MRPTIDPRFKQAAYEAKCAILLTLCYMVLWFVTAYGIPSGQLLYGIPLWFLLSCIINPLFFIGLCLYVVKTRFHHMDLGADQ